MLDPDFKAKWIAELRSGKHKQARGRYEDDAGGLCCLAVAGNVVLQVSHPWSDFDRLGLTNTCELVLRNDGKRGHHPHSFEEIADYIEANL